MAFSSLYDDFGTRYSSLSYLSRLPISQVKIDRSFVQYIDINESDAMIAQTIIGMANNLGFNEIAEGVETQSQPATLEQHDKGEYLTFLLGDESYAIEILKVRKIEYNELTMVIILNLNGRVVGVVVDGVSDVVALKVEQIGDVPSLVSTIDTKYIVGLATLAERMLILVDIEQLMSSQAMALIDSAELH